MEKVVLGEPIAKALGYTPDAQKVPRNKHKPPHSKCSNCLLYQINHKEKENDSLLGTCAIFANKLVSASGWCQAWIGHNRTFRIRNNP
ncbi:MAG: hypothetical protein D3909_02150 [Candidatus Electrothrix sp. ATG1]|nr:hypothetical protein [Candidatus Electrothrix sp. ATG1]